MDMPDLATKLCLIALRNCSREIWGGVGHFMKPWESPLDCMRKIPRDKRTGQLGRLTDVKANESNSTIYDHGIVQVSLKNLQGMDHSRLMDQEVCVSGGDAPPPPPPLPERAPPADMRPSAGVPRVDAMVVREQKNPNLLLPKSPTRAPQERQGRVHSHGHVHVRHLRERNGDTKERCEQLCGPLFDSQVPTRRNLHV